MSTSAAAASTARTGGLSAYVELARPFTLLSPALGGLSGAVTAWGAGHSKPPVTTDLLMPVLYGTLMAAVLNAASNAINQIYERPG